MSHPDDSLHAESFSLDDLDAYGAMFSEDPSSFSAGDPSPFTEGVPSSFTTDEPAAPPAFTSFDDEDDELPAPRPKTKSSGGPLGRFKEGLALARGQKPAEDDDELVTLADESDDSGDTQPATGLLGRFKEGLALARQSEPSDAQAPVKRSRRRPLPSRPAADVKATDGLDISPPKRRPWQRKPAAPQAAPEQDPFAKLLSPLTSGELARLQAEMVHEDPVIVLVDRARQSGERFGRLGGALGLLAMLALILTVASRHVTDGLSDIAGTLRHVPYYFIDTAENAGGLPSWVSETIAKVEPDLAPDITQGIAAILCFVLALVAARVTSIAATAVMHAIRSRSIIHLVRGAAGAVGAVKMFSALAEFQPVPALITAAVFGVVNAVLSRLGGGR